MGFPCQSDSMRRARDVCEGISDGMILHFHIIANMGFWRWRDRPCWWVQKDETRPRIVSSNYGREVSVICNTITLWNNQVIRVNMHIKRVDCFYNSINRSDCCDAFFFLLNALDQGFSTFLLERNPNNAFQWLEEPLGNNLIVSYNMCNFCRNPGWKPLL